MSKEKFRNILISFACDYDNNKWSNDDVYNKYSIVLSQMFNDLEAKLAESENTACKNLAELTKIATEKDRKMEELKQQFAESKEQLNNSEQKCLICNKERENEQLKKEIEYLQKQCEINQDVIDLMRQNSKKDKISFAVEKLEEVKNEFFDISNGWWVCFRDGTQYMTHRELEGCVEEVINNKIKQLKDGK